MPSLMLHHEVIPGNGPSAFFLHGLLSSRLQWQPNIAALTRHVRPVLIDLWGHGLSPAPLNESAYTVEAYFQQFELIRQSLGVSRLVVISHSFGTALAMQYVIHYPEHVQALVITNSTTAFTDGDDASVRVELERMAQQVEAGGHEAIRALPMHPRRGTRFPEDLRNLLVDQADALAPEAIVHAARITAPKLSALHDLKRIQCPVLLVNGRREVSFQGCRDIAEARIPHCEVVDLDAGHAVNLENPRGFDAATTNFLARTLRDEGWQEGCTVNR